MKKDYTPLDLLHLIRQKPSNEQTNNNITNFSKQYIRIKNITTDK